ncbi:molybdate ABC transporter substrate-binding protein [Gellertiella hungarica]|uniref:Molybdate transport system substrate-binding protein n=1 Tax=Gellertiella hungarica TaxID=1572859 RepID=A0A7W6J409_9HYPH|nr:molybdate ABC transporter substrate-binding protein [Gellertiella hungarica]MBB4064380.1 molybdate transport system substrate-binding protein [Gellertiella hungarica]
MPLAPTRRAVLAAVLLLALPASGSATERPVTVFAAASLKDVLTDLAGAYERETGDRAVLSFAASSALARQVEAGAPADIFLSADRKWMTYLKDKGLIRDETVRDLLGNRLVLVGAPGAAKAEIGAGFDLAGALGEGRLAVGLTASVPAGIYARQALERLNLWDDLKDRLAEAENVRAALTLVARGEAPLGIVYETDALAEKGVAQIGIFPEDSHEPIVYPAALTKTAEGEKPAAFLEWLSSGKARAAFEKAGFRVLAPK